VVCPRGKLIEIFGGINATTKEAYEERRPWHANNTLNEDHSIRKRASFPFKRKREGGTDLKERKSKGWRLPVVLRDDPTKKKKDTVLTEGEMVAPLLLESNGGGEKKKLAWEKRRVEAFISLTRGRIIFHLKGKGKRRSDLSSPGGGKHLSERKAHSSGRRGLKNPSLTRGKEGGTPYRRPLKNGGRKRRESGTRGPGETSPNCKG